MQNKISLFKKYKDIIENFGSLYIIQIANIVFPLITLPYLVRVLGIANFGLVTFAQVFLGYFVILVDFGFELSATRFISINRDNKEKITRIFSAIMLIKVFLLVLSFLILLLLVSFVPKFNADPLLYCYMFGIVIGQGLFPVWFFQGMQKMKYITFLNLITKTLFLVLVFVFIQSPDDYLNYPILVSLGYILIVPISIWLIKKEFGVSWQIPQKEDVRFHFKESSHFFISRVSVSIYESSSIFILGLATNNTITGYYAVADKLRAALQRLYSPISRVLYPYIAAERNLKLYKKLFLYINILNILGLIVLFAFAPFILELLFNNVHPLSVTALRIFSVVLMLAVPSILFGYPLLGALGYTNYANYSVVVASIFHIMGLIVLFLLGKVGAISIAILLLLSTIVELSVRAYGVKKYKVLREE
ncbi:MAG: oligosaccharide flippase family protein [Flavobacteriaceae bacterium]|nr:oligosaccharide flippase family protein [Flavobacteriaceae bacterium]